MSIKVLIRLLGIMLFLAALFTVSCGGSAEVNIYQSEPTEESAAAPASTPQTIPEVKIMSWDSPPPMIIDTGKKYTAIIETEKGTLVLELFARDVPKTVNNFVFLARKGYYDGTTFHRVIPGFMAQAGDPTGTGRGGPGYRFEDEFTEHKHDTGALSMANAGPNTNGSQFFITYVPVHQLDGKHTVFGQIVDGMDVLQNITPRDPNQNPQFEGDRITRIIISEEEIYPHAGSSGA